MLEGYIKSIEEDGDDIKFRVCLSTDGVPTGDVKIDVCKSGVKSYGREIVSVSEDSETIADIPFMFGDGFDEDELLLVWSGDKAPRGGYVLNWKNPGVVKNGT